MSKKLILVTGGLGFIGKHFVQRCLEIGHYVTNVDVVNYAADRVKMKSFAEHSNYRFIQQDISVMPYLPESDFVVNFAAESHVDNSIADNRQFCVSNFLGTQRMLELCKSRSPVDGPHFIQISTDEVYGDILSGKHNETDILKPSNPYSATKASADMLVLGWARTYGLRYNILRITNNYGPHQYPEKLIPKSAWRMSRGLRAIMHGDGSYVRSWLHVLDTVEAILTVIEKGEPNTIYNIKGDIELQNRFVIDKIAQILNIKGDYIEPVVNRAGQDLRYSLDDSRLRALGWRPVRDFDVELINIVTDLDFQRFI
jgi:dTDP-glucose 4,6-dehydratase